MEAVDTAYLTTEAVSENETKVTWAMIGKTKFPFNLVCLLIHSKIEKNFEQGLSQLKTIVESQISVPTTVEETDVETATTTEGESIAATDAATTNVAVTPEVVKTEEVKK